MTFSVIYPIVFLTGPYTSEVTAAAVDARASVLEIGSGFRGDVSGIQNSTWIRSLVITTELPSYAWISEMEQLESLRIGIRRVPDDFSLSDLGQVRSLEAPWWPTCSKHTLPPGLVRLSLRFGRVGRVSDLQGTQIESISISHSSVMVMDPDGLLSFDLLFAEVGDCSQLAGGPKLVSFWAQGCSGIVDVSGLAGCVGLRRFGLVDCSPVQSVRVLAECPKLSVVGLFGTIVEDGDTEFLEKLRLERRTE